MPASATIEIRQRSIEIRFRRRANNPFPLAANHARMRPAIPWLGDRTHPQIPLSLHVLNESGNPGQGIDGTADKCAVPGPSDEVVQAPDSLGVPVHAATGVAELDRQARSSSPPFVGHATDSSARRQQYTEQSRNRKITSHFIHVYRV